MVGRCAPHTSKLVMIVPTAPAAKSITPATCVGTSTFTVRMRFGSLVIVRSGKLVRADPATRDSGPSRVTSAVR